MSIGMVIFHPEESGKPVYSKSDGFLLLKLKKGDGGEGVRLIFKKTYDLE